MEQRKWSRVEIVNLVLDIERELKFENLTIDGIKIWPWVRIKLFVFLINSLERKNNISIEKKNWKNELINKCKNIKYVASHIYKYSILKKSDYLFVGSKAYRVKESGSWMNRFFDPLILNEKIQNRSVSIDIDITFGATFNNEHVLYLPIIKKILKLRNKRSNVSNNNKKTLQDLVDEINTAIKSRNVGCEIDIKNGFKAKLFKGWDKVIGDALVWEKIFQKVRPKAIFTLCYYADSVFAANLAASRCNVRTIELQHGPINHLHLAYGSFYNIQGCKGSQLLPNSFLAWDASSRNALVESFEKKTVIDFGHPWLDYNRLKTVSKVNTDRKIITYALQPSREMGNPFPDFLIKWINDSKDEYIWWFRLHPRQFKEYESIKNTLSDLLIDVKWELDAPTSKPLPEVLIQSKYIVTFCSGVISEAAFMGVPSIALSEIANDYYRHEREIKMLYVINDKDKSISWQSFSGKLQSYIVLNTVKRQNSFYSFKKVLETL